MLELFVLNQSKVIIKGVVTKAKINSSAASKRLTAGKLPDYIIPQIN